MSIVSLYVGHNGPKIGQTAQNCPLKSQKTQHFTAGRIGFYGIQFHWPGKQGVPRTNSGPIHEETTFNRVSKLICAPLCGGFGAENGGKSPFGAFSCPKIATKLLFWHLIVFIDQKVWMPHRIHPKIGVWKHQNKGLSPLCVRFVALNMPKHPKMPPLGGIYRSQIAHVNSKYLNGDQTVLLWH